MYRDRGGGWKKWGREGKKGGEGCGEIMQAKKSLYDGNSLMPYCSVALMLKDPTRDYIWIALMFKSHPLKWVY